MHIRRAMPVLTSARMMVMEAAMLAAARTFCAVVEQQDLVEPRAAAEQILLALTDVVAAAARLPCVEYTEDDSAVEVTTAQWQVTYRRIGQLLGPYSGPYWEVTYPLAEDERAARPSLGDVVDDLADVWRDLTDGLLRLEAGALIVDVLGQWRESYWSHWGHHAASATRAVMLQLTGRGTGERPVPR